MKQSYSAIVEVSGVIHYKRYHGVRIVEIKGIFTDAESARTHFHVKHGQKIIIVVPSSDARRVVRESNYTLLPGNGV